MQNNNPLVTFSVLFYNQESFVKDAVMGAFSQDYNNLEIVFSDDCSTDNTYFLLKKIVDEYKGPHKIILNRNEKNLGIAAHCEKVFKDFFNGKIMVVAGGDDVSHPTRVSESVAFLMSHPGVISVTTLSEQVDINLHSIVGANTYMCEGQESIFSLEDYCRFSDFIINSGDSRAFRRELIDKFPPLSHSKEEDLEMFVRSLYLGQVAILRKVLVKRRVYGGNVSKKAHSINYRENQKRQLLSDATFALHQGLINQSQYDKIQNKICDVIQRLINVDNSRRHPVMFSITRRLGRYWESFSNRICKI